MHILAENGGENTTGTRVLEFMKSNYSALSERVELQWSNGLFVPVRAPSAPDQAARNTAADMLFLTLLEKATLKGVNVNAKPTANNYAPTVFAGSPEARAARLGRDDFAAALDRLIEADRIVAETYGPPSRRATRIVIERAVG
jgi:hypothetical protein